MQASEHHAHKVRIVLEAGRARGNYVKDLWRYRELLYTLSWRDFSIRYKQTAIGVLWAVLRPALTAAILTLVFGRLGGFDSGGVPYILLVFAAMLPWQLFSAGLTDSGNSLVMNSALITKVYFPRLIIPLSALFTSFVDFAISAAITLGIMAVEHVAPSPWIVLLPLFALLAMLAAAGVGIWISALNVKYRDFGYVVPFIAQMGVYISPIGYRTSMVPAKWQTLFHLNPMVGIIDGARWCLLGNEFRPRPLDLALSVAVIALILATGIAYFRKTEAQFADVI